MNWLRKHKNIILVIVIVGFVMSTFVGFGLYLRFGSGSVNTVVEVNNEKVPYRQFTTLYGQVINRRRDSGDELTPETLQSIKQEVIQGLIQESVFHQEAQRYGIQVTDKELAQSLLSIPAFQKDGKFNVQSYAQTLQYGLRTTPEDFEDTQRRQIAIARLRAFVMQGIKVSNQELEMEYSMRLKANPKDELLEDKETLRRKIREEKGAHILNRWYQQLGTNVKVKIHLNEIERQRQP